MSWIKRFPLVSFFVLAYGFSWASWIPMAIITQAATQTIGLVLMIIGSFGPALSAVIVISVTEGISGIKELTKRIFKWRLSPIWYLLTLSIPVIVALVSYMLYITAGGETQELADLQPWYNYFPALLYVFFLGGGQEEPGWRGFALPRLQTRYGALAASIILGVLWALWHSPLFFIPGSTQSALPVLEYLLHTVVLSIVLTWIYNSTRGSILLAMLFHAGSNAIANWIPISATEGLISQFIAVVIIEAIVVILLICFYGPFKLSKTKRGYTGSVNDRDST